MLLPDSPRPHLKASVLPDMKIQKFTINYTEGSDTVAIPKSWCLLIKFSRIVKNNLDGSTECRSGRSLV